MENKKKLYMAFELLWDKENLVSGEELKIYCPKCKLLGNMILKHWGGGGYCYICINCSFEKTFPVEIKHKASVVLNMIKDEKLKLSNDIEIVKLDDVLIKIQREEIKDNDYWIDVKLSTNKKGQKQLMVLAGSRKSQDKTQLFLDIDNEKLSFDQNNNHPKKIFCKVKANFKKSEQEIK